MSRVHSDPVRSVTGQDRIDAARRTFEVRVIPVVCPVCDRGIFSNGLDKHLRQPAETDAVRIAQGYVGGHGFDQQKAAVYRARVMALVDKALREVAQATR